MKFTQQVLASLGVMPIRKISVQTVSQSRPNSRSSNAGKEKEGIEEEEEEAVQVPKKFEEFREGDFGFLPTIGRDINGGLLQMARHRVKSVCMVLKIHKKQSLIEEPANLANVHAELQTYKRLFYEEKDHCPFLVSMLGHFQTENRLYMVLTHVHGERRTQCAFPVSCCIVFGCSWSATSCVTLLAAHWLSAWFHAGGDLFHHLQARGKFEDPVAAFFTAEIVIGLEALHSKVGECSIVSKCQESESTTNWQTH